MKSGNNNMSIRIQKYLADKDFCVGNVLRHYFKITESLRPTDNPFLWITVVKPQNNNTK